MISHIRKPSWSKIVSKIFLNVTFTEEQEGPTAATPPPPKKKENKSKGKNAEQKSHGAGATRAVLCVYIGSKDLWRTGNSWQFFCTLYSCLFQRLIPRHIICCAPKIQSDVKTWCGNSVHDQVFVHINLIDKIRYKWERPIKQRKKYHREPTQSVWVADCYFIVNVLDLPFASPIAIYR